MERLNDLSREELIHLLMIKTDTITQYDILCAKHAVLFEKYRELCRKHISFLKDRNKSFKKEDWDSFKVLYFQANQAKKEIQKICNELRELECAMKQALKQAASSQVCN
jgi:hypothetical protein